MEANLLTDISGGGGGVNCHLKPQLFPGVKYNVLQHTFAKPVGKPIARGLPTANLFWTNPCSSTFDASFADWGSKCRLRKIIGGGGGGGVTTTPLPACYGPVLCAFSG